MTDASVPPDQRPRDKRYWQDRRVVVVGAGLSGVAAARLLRDCGARVTVNDARAEADIPQADELHDHGIALIAGEHPERLWREADTAVFSPGIRPDAPVTVAARDAGIEIVAEIEVAGGLVEAPIIAITGSNGKSTVTSMVGAIMVHAGRSAPVCGNIGTALCAAARAEVIDGAAPDGYVVEISSFQAHGIDRFHPRLAAVLNLQPDHIDWHGSMDAYAAAKLRLVRNMGPGDAIVFNRDDAEVVRRLPPTDAELIAFARQSSVAQSVEGAGAFGMGGGSGMGGESGVGGGSIIPPAAWIDEDAIWWWPAGGERRALLRLDELGVIGRHNQANACAAAALAARFGIDIDDIAAALRAYRALEHRMEPCGEVDGVRCINDSKATNVDSTLAALSGFERGIRLILGGRDKNADFTRLLPVLDARVAAVLLIGEASDAIAAALEPAREVQRCETLERAVDRALESASPGDTLLMSPACTSFDQYRNFEERGRHFKRLVAERAGADNPIPDTATEVR